ncbi:hypothetical protein K1719_018505 [Acacia pycnantha]|nr:hypothetical protein K1719_018505 [Acacia pycnantha]
MITEECFPNALVYKAYLNPQFLKRVFNHLPQILWRHPLLGAHASRGHKIERSRRRTRTVEDKGGERHRRKTRTAEDEHGELGRLFLLKS